MLNRIIVCSTVIAGLLVLSGTMFAQDPLLVHYRDSDGRIDQQSKENAHQMARIAREAGHVKLWLTLNYPFNIYLDEMTPQLDVFRFQ